MPCCSKYLDMLYRERLPLKGSFCLNYTNLPEFGVFLPPGKWIANDANDE